MAIHTPTCVMTNSCAIYDLFYRSIDKSLVLVAPFSEPHSVRISEYGSAVPKRVVCPHGHTLIVIFENVPFIKTVTLDIDGTRVTANVNLYDTKKGKAIISTEVQNESRHLKYWVDYHLALGFDNIIIYDNASQDRSELLHVLGNYISDEIVDIMYWDYPRRVPKSRISGQTTQQNHSLYAFHEAEFCGLMDVDEYLVPQKRIRNFKIRDFLRRKFDFPNAGIGALSIQTRTFGNPLRLPESEAAFLDVPTCKFFTEGREKRQKCLVVPKNVRMHSVHMVLIGERTAHVAPCSMVFNHYVFLNKSNRGREWFKYLWRDRAISYYWHRDRM